MGIINTLTKVEANRVCGLDASTNSLAFAVFERGNFVVAGEIKFKGATPFERLRDARYKTRKLVESGILGQLDYVVIESAIMVRNVQTAIDLAYVFGAVISEMSEVTRQLHKVAPISWQSGIGVPNLKKHEKEQIQKDFPGKSKTWYQNKGREIRKSRISKFCSKFLPNYNEMIETGLLTDNITDAIGIAYFASTKLVHFDNEPPI